MKAMTRDELFAERQALLREQAVLEAEHRQLVNNPRDSDGHLLRHSEHLKRHVERLHAYTAALREQMGTRAPRRPSTR